MANEARTDAWQGGIANSRRAPQVEQHLDRQVHHGILDHAVYVRLQDAGLSCPPPKYSSSSPKNTVTDLTSLFFRDDRYTPAEGDELWGWNTILTECTIPHVTLYMIALDEDRSGRQHDGSAPWAPMMTLVGSMDDRCKGHRSQMLGAARVGKLLLSHEIHIRHARAIAPQPL